MEEEMDNSVKGNAAEKAIELGLDDLQAISGGILPETFAKLYELHRRASVKEGEARANKQWEAANIYKTMQLDIKAMVDEPHYLALLS
jgi:hypothetical protein